jgi:hypothetical protein
LQVVALVAQVTMLVAVAVGLAVLELEPHLLLLAELNTQLQ